MTEVTRILSAIEHGDPHAAEQLLPLVYDELRRLAAQKMAQEKPGQTLEATALVHEAYLRLVGNQPPSPQAPTTGDYLAPAAGETGRGEGAHWNSRGHFFAAAAEAMRRILVENARRKKADRRGGQLQRVSLDHARPATVAPPDELLAVDEALERLERHDPVAGKLVKLRYYAGLSLEQAAEALAISAATAYRHWAFSRAWLHSQLLADGEDSGS